MKVYWKRPAKEVRIVRPGNEGNEYEIWVLTPVCIGTALKQGTARVIVDGTPYTNLNTAAKILLENAKEDDLALGMRTSVRGDHYTVSGLDLVERNAWLKFCAARKINPRSTADMAKTYSLTRSELEELGLQQPAG